MKNPENLYLRGNAWYYRFEFRGREFRGSCFTHDVRLAKKTLREKMAEAEANPDATSVATTRFTTTAQMAAHDIDRARLKRSSEAVIASTITRYWDRLGVAFAHAGEITRDALHVYARRMIDHGLAPQTVKRDLWAAKRGYEYAQGLDPTLPALGKLPELKVDEPGKGKGVPVPLDDVKRFLEACQGRARDHAIILLMTGLRISEFRRLGEVMWFGSERSAASRMFLLEAKQTKNGRRRYVGVSHVLWLVIRRSAPYTISNNSAWRTASKRAGLSKAMMARDLRHIYASALAPFDSYGVDLTMGHAPGLPGTSTRWYQHADEDRLRRLAAEAERVFSFAIDLAARH